jgi:hypothetical protein
MPILRVFCALALPAAEAVIPNIAMVRVMHLLSIAILRWVVVGAAFGNVLTLPIYLSPIPG